MKLSSCGIDCDACKFKVEANCPGCHAIKGKTFWSRGETCGLYACAADSSLPHCGQCGEFPCGMLQEWAISESPERIDNLRALRNTGAY